ncbi:sigma-70 family RNA polymerase sigma factor [Leptobacterium flavescens]|uniref:RNA polymerase sigma factor n=2 Tax=Leptobacterium flavescens TaxID=472055 RepID=A0A6P0UKV4_9FLAO|nr:sigma-70 family RNA polymerase sigma factor [Leptobacterium flavescens]
MHAFRLLVEKYKDISLSLACSILKDRDKAEDVLQDAFVKVYRKLNSFRGTSAFATWLYRIVVNTAYNALKKEKRQAFIRETEVDLPETKEPEKYEDLKREEQQKYINMAMDKLKADEALVLRLYYLCDLNSKEIRKITGFSNSKIKVDLHRGRNNLYRQLERILGTEIKDLL